MLIEVIKSSNLESANCTRAERAPLHNLKTKATWCVACSWCKSWWAPSSWDNTANSCGDLWVFEPIHRLISHSADAWRKDQHNDKNIIDYALERQSCEVNGLSARTFPLTQDQVLYNGDILEYTTASMLFSFSCMRWDTINLEKSLVYSKNRNDVVCFDSSLMHLTVTAKGNFHLLDAGVSEFKLQGQWNGTPLMNAKLIVAGENTRERWDCQLYRYTKLTLRAFHRVLSLPGALLNTDAQHTFDFVSFSSYSVLVLSNSGRGSDSPAPYGKGLVTVYHYGSECA